MTRFCFECQKPLQGRQQKYCGAFCRNHRKTLCPKCGGYHHRHLENNTDLCRFCVRTGENNPAWKGGHAYWQEGKLGRDKDGLSWKTQRQLAWERDNYTCQDCGKTREQTGRKPDVDHEVPYRISFSHALPNLKCRCRSCHKKAEAARPELWGVQSLKPHKKGNPTPTCDLCGKRRKLEEGKCTQCLKETILIPRAVELRSQGWSFEKIGAEIGVDFSSVAKWLRRILPVPQRITK